MLIGVPRETAAGETRVAVTPETAKKLKAQGNTVRVESGAGVAASVTDAAYAAAGAEIVAADAANGALSSADMVLRGCNLAPTEWLHQHERQTTMEALLGQFLQLRRQAG